MRQSRLHVMPAIIGAFVLSGVLLAVPAMAKSQTEHLRGTISAVSDSGFTVKTEDGSMRKVALGSNTKIAGVVPSSLDRVKKGTFIGAANVKRDGQARALEVVVFPESMKGAGLGDYPWDLSPADVNASNGSKQSMEGGSSMTNGTVESSGSASGKESMSSGGSSMTNGTVESSNSASSNESMEMNGGSSMTNGTVTQSEGGSKMSVKVDYGEGSKTITIPKDVPVVALQKGSQSDIKQGEHVFVAGPQGSDPFQAKLVMVGIDGTVPPM